MKQEKIDYKKIYDDMKNNSIGEEKKCSYKKQIRNLPVKIGLPIVTGILLSSCLMGCIQKEKEQTTTNDIQIEHSYDYYGYSISEMSIYAEYKLNNLLVKNNYLDYTKNDGKRSYNYSADDYKMLPELDETYLHGFYSLTDSNTVTEVSKALGYENFDDYLITNGYVKEDGTPDTKTWYKDCLSKTGKEMSNLEKGKIK